MIRIHVLLLASLLSIWGLTSCENSDTDKVNSYNLEVNLSQNEITAINGIISIKVSIKEFDQLAYLVINKINDTNNISEKYIKSNLSPEYIFEYIIKKDDSSTFYLCLDVHLLPSKNVGVSEYKYLHHTISHDF